MSRAIAERKVLDSAARVLRIRAHALRSEIYGRLERSITGRGPNMGTYRRASAPGDSPARQTGRLQESVKVVSFDAAKLTATVGPDPADFSPAYYALYLEFGTRHMAPRPFMRPALEEFKRAVLGQRS